MAAVSTIDAEPENRFGPRPLATSGRSSAGAEARACGLRSVAPDDPKGGAAACPGQPRAARLAFT